MTLKGKLFMHKGIISAVKRAEFVNDRMSYIVLSGHWHYIFIPNVHELTEGKSDDKKNKLYEKPENIFKHFPAKERIFF
jgi:hypothetical protein